MRKITVFMLAFALVSIALAEAPSVYPKLDRRVQVNVSSVMWPERIFIRWKQNDGTWFCTWIDRQLPRTPNLSGVAAWIDVELYALAVPSPATLSTFERTYCFSWLPE